MYAPGRDSGRGHLAKDTDDTLCLGRTRDLSSARCRLVFLCLRFDSSGAAVHESALVSDPMTSREGVVRVRRLPRGIDGEGI